MKNLPVQTHDMVLLVSEPSTKQPYHDQSRDYLTSIVHELKNPISAIIAFSDILQEDITDPKTVQDCLDHAKEIIKIANDLNELVHDLLDANSINSGSFAVDLSQEIDIADIIRRSVKINYDYSLLRHIIIKTTIENDLELVKLDAKRMKQILNNLISNALKYSPDKTEISIHAQNIVDLENKKFLQIKVCDQGFGMSETELAAIFEKYKTFDNPNRGKVDSLGLGLPITKHLVELQNGSISFESKPNQGTEVTLKFPI